MSRAPNAAERIAALTAIKEALEKEIAADKLEALAFAGEFGIRSFDTALGVLTVASRGAGIGWYEAQLLKWVETNYPGEVEHTRRVRPAFQAVLAQRFIVEGDAVIDTATGAVVDFAYVTAAGAPYLTYPSSEKKKAAQALGRRVVQDRALGWAKSVLPEVES